MSDRPLALDNFLQTSSDGATLLAIFRYPVGTLALVIMAYSISLYHQTLLHFSTSDYLVCSLVVIPILAFTLNFIFAGRLLFAVPVFVLLYMCFQSFTELAYILAILTDLVQLLFAYTLYPFCSWIVHITGFDTAAWLASAKANSGPLVH